MAAAAGGDDDRGAAAAALARAPSALSVHALKASRKAVRATSAKKWLLARGSNGELLPPSPMDADTYEMILASHSNRTISHMPEEEVTPISREAHMNDPTGTFNRAGTQYYPSELKLRCGNHLFWSHFKATNDRLTETGSGQTLEGDELTGKTRFVPQRGLCKEQDALGGRVLGRPLVLFDQHEPLPRDVLLSPAAPGGAHRAVHHHALPGLLRDDRLLRPGCGKHALVEAIFISEKGIILPKQARDKHRGKS